MAVSLAQAGARSVQQAGATIAQQWKTFVDTAVELQSRRRQSRRSRCKQLLVSVSSLLGLCGVPH
jgi:hypothetical protein